ncbi:MAG: class I SAM-dependent methyltransferase [Pirellulaceae bacterium]
MFSRWTSRVRHHGALLFIFPAFLSALSAQDPTATGSHVPPARDEYLGRQIAQTMHYNGAEWLIRDVREREERCSLMLANLGVRTGQTILDMGCGNGFYSLPLAKMVGATGRILAVDIQPEMLVMLRTRMEQEGIDNVSPILGSVHNPRVPAATVDLILLVDVYHEFSHPEPMLAAMRTALKPQGLLVLVEYRAEDPEVPIQPLHKMSRAQILKEMTANGLRLAQEFDKLPWQHMMFFGRDEQWDPDTTSTR